MARPAWLKAKIAGTAQKAKRPAHAGIPKAAVRAFLDAPRRDLRALKEASPARLLERSRKLEIRPPLFQRLQHEQQVCFLIGAKYRYVALHLDTGMGKTLTALALIRYFNELGDVNSCLVLVPARTNKTEWVREINKHIDEGRLPEDFSYTVLRGSSEDKWRTLRESTALVVIETIGGFARMACELVKTKKKGVNKLKPSKKLVDELCRMFDGFVVDESTSVANHNSLAFRILRQMRKRAQLALPMTGTPFGRDPAALWSQMYLADQGEAIGKTLGMFRAAFFNEKEDAFGHITYEFDKSKDQLLNDLLAHSSVAYEADESTLPILIPQRQYVSLPEDADVLYQKAKRQLIDAAKAHDKTGSNNAFLRMRQISSGFVGYDDDELCRRAQFEFPFQPKRDRLLNIIEHIRPDHKIIVFTDFVFSGSMIGRELEKMGIGFARLWGGTKDIDGERYKFEDDPACRVLLLQNGMAAGLNLQIVKYGIYYESPVSPITRKQTRRRFERQHSDHNKVFQIDLICRGTMDEAILKWHSEAGGLFDAIIRGDAKL